MMREPPNVWILLDHGRLEGQSKDRLDHVSSHRSHRDLASISNLCESDFHHYAKISKIIHLQRERFLWLTVSEGPVCDWSVQLLWACDKQQYGEKTYGR